MENINVYTWCNSSRLHCTWCREMGIYACFSAYFTLPWKHIFLLLWISRELQVGLELHCGQTSPALAAGRRTLGRPQCSLQSPACAHEGAGDLTSHQPGFFPLKTRTTNLPCLPLCSLCPRWPSVPTCDGQGTTSRHKDVYKMGLALFMTAKSGWRGKDSSSRRGWMNCSVSPPAPWLLPPQISAPYAAGCFTPHTPKLSYFLPKQNNVMICRFVEGAFEFCKNSNVCSGFSCLFVCLFSESYIAQVSFTLSHP